MTGRSYKWTGTVAIIVKSPVREINDKVRAQVQQNRLKYLLGILGMNFQSLNHTQCDEK